MRVLIVDDSLNKLDDVSKTLISNNKNSAISIDTCEDIQSALLFLQTNEIDLLILDQFLPQRKEQKEDVLQNGGKILLGEINRKPNRIITPKYIVGLTQFYDENNDFSPIWTLLNYSPNETKWSLNLSKIILHINNVSIKRKDEKYNTEIKPTIFLEGLTDLTLFEIVINTYYSDLKEHFYLKSQKNAGANWVAQQIIIWGHLLHKKDNINIKAIALFDADDAGNKARLDISKKLTTANQQLSCKSLQLQAKHAPNLIELYKIGIKVEIEIESLLPIKILNIADEKGWLEFRQPLFLQAPKDWNPVNETIPEYLYKKGISKDYIVFLKKISLKHKRDFIDFVISENKKDSDILINIKNVFDELKSEIL